LLVALVATHVTARPTSFEELTAQRINIVSPAGQTVIAISNKERIAAPVMGSEERFAAMGLIRRGVIVVVWAEPSDDVIRIISARFATKREIASYRRHT